MEKRKSAFLWSCGILSSFVQCRKLIATLALLVAIGKVPASFSKADCSHAL